jgi:hypothetical protein
VSPSIFGTDFASLAANPSRADARMLIATAETVPAQTPVRAPLLGSSITLPIAEACWIDLEALS